MQIVDLLNIKLENEWVKLEPLQVSDVDELWEISQDKDLSQFGHKDLGDYPTLKAYIESAIRNRKEGSCAVWKVVDKRTGKTAGSTRIAEISEHDERGQIGWTWIGKEFQGSGLNKAMKFEVLKYAFEALKLNRVEFKADERNLQSRKAMLKIGATEEGTLRQHLKLHNGFIRNSVYYSILKTEWPAIKERIFADFV